MLAEDCPRPERLAFSLVLCTDDVYDRIGAPPTDFICVDPLAVITIRISIARADAATLAAALTQVKALGAEPRVMQ